MVTWDSAVIAKTGELSAMIKRAGYTKPLLDQLLETYYRNGNAKTPFQRVWDRFMTARNSLLDELEKNRSIPELAKLDELDKKFVAFIKANKAKLGATA